MLRTFTGNVTVNGETREFSVEAYDERSARLLVMDDYDADAIDAGARPLTDDDAFDFDFDYAG